MGWPLPGGAFGGCFCYPLEPRPRRARPRGRARRAAAPTSTCTTLLQRMKLHPLFRRLLEGGEMVEWGAKTIPEGGFYVAARAAPRRRRARARRRRGLRGRGRAQGHPLRDAVGHRGRRRRSSRRSRRATRRAPRLGGLRRGAWTARAIVKDLRARRNMRLAFKSGFFLGGAQGRPHDARRGARSPAGASRCEARRRRGREVVGAADAVRARRQAHLQQGGRASSSRATRPATTSRRHLVVRRGRPGRGRRPLRAPVPRRRLRAPGRQAASSTRPTASTARRPTSSARAGRPAKAAAGPVQADVGARGFGPDCGRRAGRGRSGLPPPHGGSTRVVVVIGLPLPSGRAGGAAPATEPDPGRSAA